MKYLSILLVVVSLAACSQASKVAEKEKSAEWLTDVNATFSLARNERKMILAEVSTTWCQYCQYVEKYIMTDPSVSEKLKDFALVRIDGDKFETQWLLDKWNVKGFPTFILFDQKGIEQKRFNDASSSEEFLELINSKNKTDPESDLAEKLKNSSADKLKVGIALAKELIEKYPESPFLPDYYKKMSEFYSSSVAKQYYLNKAKDIIEDRLKNFDKIDKRVARITISEQINLLADIYKDLKQFDNVIKTYSTGAELGEKLATAVGYANSGYMIAPTVSYYLSAGQADKAVIYLDKCMKDAPDYWPVYSSYAKVMLAKKNFKNAESYAKKAYEVAKPRVALLLADIFAAQNNYAEALATLQNAKNDMIKNPGSKSGSAYRILKQLDDRIEEFKTL